MNNSLRVKQNDNILSKIFYFVRKLFYKNKLSNQNLSGKNVNEKVTLDNNDLNFLGDLKNKVIENEVLLDKVNKDYLIKEIEENPEMLESMDLKKLQDIDQYYDEIIEGFKKKLNIT